MPTVKPTVQKLASALQLVEYENLKKSDSGFSEKYLMITDKSGERIHLKKNRVQRKLQEVINHQRKLGIPPRVIVLKSRQMGISTDTEGRMTKDTTTKPNRNGLVIAHRSDSTAALFAKTKYFVDNLPERFKPLQQASNASEVIFDKPTNYIGPRKGLHGKIKIHLFLHLEI